MCTHMSYHSLLFLLEFLNAVYRPDLNVYVLHYNTVKYMYTVYTCILL